MRLLSGSLDCSDDDTRIQSPPGVTWPAGASWETDGSTVMVIQAGENVLVVAFALNGQDSVDDDLLEVVAGPVWDTGLVTGSAGPGVGLRPAWGCWPVPGVVCA